MILISGGGSRGRVICSVLRFFRSSTHGVSITAHRLSCFLPKRKVGQHKPPISYRRFATAAEAIRFAVENFSAVRTLGAWMQVGDERFNGDEIYRLYESSSYPLRRDA
jgi:hypothetical protein